MSNIAGEKQDLYSPMMAKIINIEQLTEIWKCNHIELFCCHCYSFKMKYQPNIKAE